MRGLNDLMISPRHVAVLLLFAAMAGPTLAQENQQDPVLPDIAPQVVEIRGQLEISLPSLQRQPLIGFNPPPRVAPIPPERRPYIEDYKQESIELPPSPLQPPAPPAVASLIGQAPRNGRFSATLGRYFSRTIDFETEWPMSDRAAIYSKANYGGSDGHVPDGASEDISASFDALDALVGVQFGSRVATFGVEVDGYLNQYLLYGAAPSPGAGHLIDEPPFRDGRGGGISAWTRTQATTGVNFETNLRYGVSAYDTDALNDDATPDERFTRDERAFEADAQLDAPIGPSQSIRADLSYTYLELEEPQAASADHAFDGAGGMHLALGRSLQLSALARLMTFHLEDSDTQTFVSPDVTLDFYPATGVRIYVQNRPRSEQYTTATMLRQSPYLTEGFVNQPTVYTIDARGGGRFVVGSFEADLHLGYSRAPNFRFFERATSAESGGYAQGLIAAHYAEAAIYYGGGDVSVILPAGLLVSAGLTVRDGSLTELDEAIPYFGPIVGRGALSYAFAGGRGFVEASTTYESAREVARGSIRAIGDYFDLDVLASYDVTSYLGLLVRMDNLSAGYLEKWEHYDESPFVIGAGLRVRW